METTTVSFTKNQTDHQATFSAPFDSIKEARLQFSNGVSHLDLTVGMRDPDLFQASFSGLIPDVRVNKGAIRVRYRLSVAEWFRHALLWDQHAAVISLNESIPWKIDLNGGVSHMKADLTALELKSLAFKGGVSQADIALPRPTRTVTIDVMGGANRVSFVCIPGVAVRLQASGGVSRLRFGEQFFGSVGERMELETPGYKDKTDRYDIHVFSGANQLSVLIQA